MVTTLQPSRKKKFLDLLRTYLPYCYLTGRCGLTMRHGMETAEPSDLGSRFVEQAWGLPPLVRRERTLHPE